MSAAMPTYPPLRHSRASASRDSPTTPPKLKVSIVGFGLRAATHHPPSSSSSSNLLVISSNFYKIRGPIAKLNALSQEEPLQELDDSPVSVELVPISSEAHFDRAVARAQELDESFVVVWMASWCRKCIYLKPKLEKLAADYYPRLLFYCIDVNSVPYKLVARAEVTKMPTIQLWEDGKKQAEVIGGHKAYLVINEVRGMIENEDGT